MYNFIKKTLNSNQNTKEKKKKNRVLFGLFGVVMLSVMDITGSHDIET